jgi:hypothetical protein
MPFLPYSAFIGSNHEGPILAQAGQYSRERVFTFGTKLQSLARGIDLQKDNQGLEVFRPKFYDFQG